MKPRLAAGLHPQIRAWWEKEDALQKEATRQGFGRGIVEAAKSDRQVIALTANLGESTGLKTFKEKYPARYVDVGVAEQTLIGVAAGLASEGLLPVATSFAVFSPGRNWDLIRVQVAMSKMPVVIVGSHAGLATGADGATHQALEDVSLMRGLPNMVVLSPLDGEEAAKMIQKSVVAKKPTYLRLVREKTPLLTTKKTSFSIGKALPLVVGSDITIFTTGAMAVHALEAAKLLWKKRVSASVIHLGTIKPLDKKAILATKGKKLVVTIEDHNIIGGLGSAVAEVIAEKKGMPSLLRLGVGDAFGESGNSAQLYKKHCIDAQGITKRIQEKLKEK